MPDQGTFGIAPIDASDLTRGFRSGVGPLDDYFDRRALSNHEKGFARTFVLREERAANTRVLGYYTLTMASVERVSTLPRAIRANAPEIHGAALLARLATDAQARGQGHGLRLLADAFEKCQHAATYIGCSSIFADAKDEGAVRFYRKFGFVTLDDAASDFPRPVVITMRAVAEILAGLQAGSRH